MTDDPTFIDPATAGVRPTACRWPPRRVSDLEAQVYERIRKKIIIAHCAAARGPHQCCGRVTLDREHVTLSCRLCGDARMTTGRGE